MGKAAENERIKLGATWYNNLSVALTFTGVLIPVFSLYKAENFQLLDDWLSLRSVPTSPQGMQLVLSLVAVCGRFGPQPLSPPLGPNLQSRLPHTRPKTKNRL
jgi:hypothetical protein